MHSLDLSNINSVLHICICTHTLNAEHFHLQLILCLHMYLLMLVLYVHMRIPRLICRLKNKLTCNFIEEKLRASSFNCNWQNAACTCVYIQVRTHQRLFRQMIVSSDAINQRRKIKSQTFECESQFESFGFVWLTYWSAAATGVKSIRKNYLQIWCILFILLLHYITQFETSDFEKFSIVGWITQAFSCLLFFVKLWEH